MTKSITNYSEQDRAFLLVAKKTGSAIQTLYVSNDLLKLCKRAYIQLNNLHDLIEKEEDKVFNDKIIKALRKTINKI